MASNFCTLSLGQLKTELRRRNAKLTGRKKELIERLEAYDRNQNFNREEDLLPEFNMSLPKTSGYRDVNSDAKMAPITMEKAIEYMNQYRVEFDAKVKDLYDDKFLLYMRLFSAPSLDFVRGACKAEMRKKVNYVVDISLHKNGYIHEAQCECGAGEGPFGHCKHIRTMIYACCKFVKDGEFKVETTCTEKLQSFHKAKKHTGSPLKARDLNLGGADICDIKDFDPRPQKFRKVDGYQDYFHNICMNFRGISKTPIFQTFSPANIRAISNDHDYFEVSHEDNFLEQCKITKLSDKDRDDIEMYTRGQNKNDRWFEEREKRIQSSNFHRVCTATERTDLHDLAKSFVRGKGLKPTEAMRHGIQYEKDAIHQYESKNNVKVKPCGIFVSKNLPFLGASPDGIVDENLLIEVKCPFSAKHKKISPVTVPYLKETNGNMTLSTKHPYYFQIQGQLFCAERQFCDLVIYTLSDILFTRIHRNENFIAHMICKLDQFNTSHFRAAILEKYFYKT
ncbi:uncharacterized protein LOC128224265 [Mya arenaria]|uniref:uncharacterized protein LOC128224265 n=1 Tax=Mya arenaria TaxID=6604 RepID=UPI0022E1C317|nr:uncharacterized protein LOC128224265 [Mya arenaria]